MTDPSVSGAPRGPDDGTSLQEVLAGYAAAGFASTFEVTDDARLRCDVCGNLIEPGATTMHSLRRLEGASDPADMSAVVALTCPICGARGTAVLMFGPEASAAEDRVLRGLRDERGDDVLPGSAAPDEAGGG